VLPSRAGVAANRASEIPFAPRVWPSRTAFTTRATVRVRSGCGIVREVGRLLLSDIPPYTSVPAAATVPLRLWPQYRDRTRGRGEEMRRVLLLLALAASSLVVVVGPGVAANDTPCTGTLTGVHDNVVVPEGQTCILAGAVIGGNLFVRPQARLSDLTAAPNNVVGNLFAERAQRVSLRRTHVVGDADLKRTDTILQGDASGGLGVDPQFRVGGDLLIEEAPGAFIHFIRVGGDLDVIKVNSLSSFSVLGVSVSQNLNVRDSSAFQVPVRQSQVGGSLQVQNNTARGGGLVVRLNDVAGNVEVRDNVSTGGSGSFGWEIDFNDIGGNFNLENNLVSAANNNPVQLNQVGENMSVIKNRGTSTKSVVTNTVGDTLRCFENDLPFVGGPNVAPRKEGQCF
jgi:hypothetical protein